MMWTELDRRGATTLSRQLYDQLMEGILTGRIPAGMKLPSTREVAAELRIARNIVLDVFDQLAAEGFLEARRGAGTFVARLRHLPRLDQTVQLRSPPVSPAVQPDPVIAFACGLPDLTRFPRERWLAAGRQVGFSAPSPVWGYASSQGSDNLRAALVQHLATSKGIGCRPEQIVLTNGGAHGIMLVALLVAEWRRGALVEDPVVSFVPDILRRCGHPVAPLAVDATGVVVDTLPERPRAGLMLVSPSHQFPVGGTLTIQRRLALLEYARRHDLFLVEDDYDSEFRYGGAPVSSLFRLDPRRAIHVGTFSKSLAPALRLGYVVLPEDLVPLVSTVLEPLHLTGSPAAQETLARFIAAGHLTRHVQRMRRVYERKMRVMVRELQATFASRVTITGHSTGLHLVATFPQMPKGPILKQRLEEAKVRCDRVEDYAWAGARFPGALALGFGNLQEPEIIAGVRRLATALRRAT